MDNEELEVYRHNAIDYYRQHFDKDKLMNQFESLIKGEGLDV